MAQTNWRKVSVACCLPCWTRYTLPYKRQRTRTFAHWHRHSVWISAIGVSVASWRKKKRSCGSDKSAHDLGRDKSKNASILRKYGSIWVGEKTNCLFWFLHKHDFVKNITCRNGYTNITSILCFVWRKCNSERISFHL